jgi:hypothetical protein
MNSVGNAGLFGKQHYKETAVQVFALQCRKIAGQTQPSLRANGLK